MIRPFTLVCMLMAGGSGLYLYQCKHQAQVLDREIGKTFKQTEAARERIGMLRAEWALLNEPDRLAELARAHTALQTLQPGQFVASADLAARLPAPVAPGKERPPGDAEPEEFSTPVAQAAPPAKPAQVAASAAVAPEPKAEPKAAVATAEPKQAAPRHASRPAPVQLATATAPAPALAHAVPARAAQAAVLPAAANEASPGATAPGSIGASVLRAMRANGYAAPQPAQAYVQPAYAPASSYAPAPSYPQGATASLLGGSRGSLPPPVPFASR